MFIVLSFGILSLARAEEPFPIGRTVDLPVEAFEDPAQVWLPTNYDPAVKWPVLFFYHGTSGKPTIEFMRLITGGKDWVIVGMGYKQKGQFNYTEENLKAEIDLFHSVFAEVTKRANLDPAKVYISGFSKGGWMTGLFLQKIPELAGGMILGGGLMEASPGRLDPADQVYIGVGESDGNIAMSFGAEDRFKEIAAEVALDVWPGIGHQYPDAFDPELCRKMSQWLQLQSGSVTRDEAIHWFDTRLRDIQQTVESDKVAAFHQLIKLSDMPYRTVLDKESAGALKTLQENFRIDPVLQGEMEAWIGFQKAIRFEGRDRYVSTLAEALVKYQNVAETYPATVYGIKSAASRDRVKALLGIE